jgi:ribosome-binding protein aMBF1 (putative translation factor)
MGGVARRNLEMFQRLVGPGNMGNVKLVTTMWSCVAPERGQLCLDELMRDFWRAMIGAGAQVDRCDDAAEDGRRIIQSILETSPITLQLQREMDGGLPLNQTAAGKFVTDQLDELRENHDREIRELREQLRTVTLGRDEAAIRNEYEEKLREQNEVAEQKRKLLELDVTKLQKEVEELKNKEGGGCTIL